MSIPGDRAVQAAIRAFHSGAHAENRIAQMTLGAREALAPIRELHKRVEGWAGFCCHHCGRHWPCATARLVYAERELSE